MEYKLEGPITCIVCSAPINVSPNTNRVTCPYCGAVIEITRFSREERQLVQAMDELRFSVEKARQAAEAAQHSLEACMYDEADKHYKELSAEYNRLRCEYESAQARKLSSWFHMGETAQLAFRYDEAIRHYQNILAECPDEAEVYWRTLLCYYGIEYVRDSTNNSLMPTVTRMQVDSILDNEYYKNAFAHARSEDVRQYYSSQATYLENVLQKYQQICACEAPYDIFISVKQGNEDGSPTSDSRVAMHLYYRLKEKGFRVFNSAETLQDKAGQEYEPYIMHALSTAKLVVVVASREEYINSPWVRNEWRRFRWLRDQEGMQTTRKIVVYHIGSNTIHLPLELGKLQMIDAQTDAAPLERILEIAPQPFDAPHVEATVRESNADVDLSKINRTVQWIYNNVTRWRIIFFPIFAIVLCELLFAFGGQKVKMELSCLDTYNFFVLRSVFLAVSSTLLGIVMHLIARKEIRNIAVRTVAFVLGYGSVCAASILLVNKTVWDGTYNIWESSMGILLLIIPFVVSAVAALCTLLTRMFIAMFFSVKETVAGKN